MKPKKMSVAPGAPAGARRKGGSCAVRSRIAQRAPTSRSWTIWILAGGLSSRMGRDKSRIQLGGRTLLQRVRDAARATGWPVRTIRHDAIPKCGPLSGIFTGLQRARTGWCLFLTCDMPLITPRLLHELIQQVEVNGSPAFVHTTHGFGFPFAVPASSLPMIMKLIESGRPAVQEFAARLDAVSFQLLACRSRELLNVNTPADLNRLRTLPV